MNERFFRRRLALAAVLIALVGLSAAIGRIGQAVPANGQPAPYVLIDPGHGGADGGAVAADGTVEKQINLAIARPTADLLRVFGYTVKMTREDDRSIHDPDATTARRQKVSDIRNRTALANGSLITVSIHQNHFPQAQYHGAVVLYAPGDPASEGLGAAVRESVLSLLQPDNERALKKSGDEVYLLAHATRPAILVECGFLSNPAEREALKAPDYQQKMAFAIAAGVLKYAP
ncbi:MAG: N-acetylmuramoyl-L-alanine amidase [Acutalibacteraceae bacterium]